MFNKFCQDNELINNLKCKKGVMPILHKGICPVQSLASGEIKYTIGVYYNEELDEKLTLLLSLWLDYDKDLLCQAEELIRLCRKNKKQSKIGIAIKSFI